MRWPRTSARSIVAALGVPLTLLLAACGGGVSQNAGVRATATVAPSTPTPATQPSALLSTVPKSAVPSSCATLADGYGVSWKPTITVGALLLGQATLINYSSAVEIQDSAPQKPLSDTDIKPYLTGISVNPNEFYGFVICNASTATSVTVQSISARIASVTPLNGAPMAWSVCKDGAYAPQTQQVHKGGCGGGLPSNEQIKAVFDANAGTGATVTATQVSTGPVSPSDPGPFPPLPLSLAPGKALVVTLDITPPTTPGAYTFALGVSADNAAPVFFSTSETSMLGPTREWSGQNCTAPATLAQIPTSNPAPSYICPPA